MASRTSQVSAPAAASFDGWESASKQDLASKGFTKRLFKDVEDGAYIAKLSIKKSDTSKKNPKTPATIVSFRYQLADDSSKVHTQEFWFNHKNDQNYNAERQAQTTERLVRNLQTIGIDTRNMTPTAAIAAACKLCNPTLTVGISVKNKEDEEANAKYGPNVYLNEVMPQEEVVDDSDYAEDNTDDDVDYDDADDDAPFDDDDAVEDEDLAEEPAPKSKTPSTPPSRRR